MADTPEPLITKAALGEPCPTCGEMNLSARSSSGGAKTCVYHNKCGHMQDMDMPWSSYVKECLDGGWIRYGSDGQTLMDPSAMRPGMEKHVYRGSQKAKEGCFIATAVYGSAEAPQVNVLRAFRDDQLGTNAVGRIWIALYYKVSPSLVSSLHGHPLIKRAVRALLNAIVRHLDRPGDSTYCAPSPSNARGSQHR